MSYDLTIFRPDKAPRTRPEFMTWFENQSEWSEGHSYDNPNICSFDMQAWFKDMIQTFPAMNGPYATDDPDNENVTDYCIGKDIIYVTFSWSLAEKAYEKMKATAEKHKVGFYDTSADDGDILFPDSNGKNIPIDRPNNLSSIQQIKSWAKPGQENFSVREIVYSRINLNGLTNEQTPKKWWQFWK
jgi:hypothetical protein